MEMNNPGMLNQIGLHVKCKLVSSHGLQTRLRIIYIDLVRKSMLLVGTPPLGKHVARSSW